MSEVSVISIGYYSFAVYADVASFILNAAAGGKIRSVEKKYIEGQTRVVLGKPVEVSAELLEVIGTREAELAELKVKLKKLEESSGEC